MAQQEEVPQVRVLPPPVRPVLPPVEGEVPAVRQRTERKTSPRVSSSHTVAVNDEMYALLLHAKHAMEVTERRLVSFAEVIGVLVEDQKKLKDLQDRIAARKAAKLAEQASDSAEEE